MTQREYLRTRTDFANVVTAIFELMLTSGIEAKDLLAISHRSLRRAEAGVRASAKRRSKDRWLSSRPAAGIGIGR